MNASALLLIALASALAQLPASPDPKPVPITGIVVDDSGRPVANADVWLAEAIPPDEGRRFGMELWYVVPHRPGRGGAADPRPRPERRRRAIRARGPGRGRRAAVAAADGRLGGGRLARRPASPSAACPASSWPTTRPSGSRSAAPAHAELTVLGARSEAGRRRPGHPHPRRRGARSPSRWAGPRRRRPTRAAEPRSQGWRPRLWARSASRRRSSASQVLQIQDSGLKIQEYPDPTIKSAILTLAPVGRIVGRLVAPRRRADPGRDGPRHVAGRRLCRIGQPRVGHGRLRRARAIRDPGHRRGDARRSSWNSTRPRSPPLRGEATQAPDREGRPGDRGDDPAARDGERPRARAREGDGPADPGREGRPQRLLRRRPLRRDRRRGPVRRPDRPRR